MKFKTLKTLVVTIFFASTACYPNFSFAQQQTQSVRYYYNREKAIIDAVKLAEYKIDTEGASNPCLDEIKEQLAKKQPQQQEYQPPKPIAQKPPIIREPAKPMPPLKGKVSGEYRLAMGIDSKDSFVLQEANSDAQEKNWRYLFGERTFNTYDPAIYDRLKIDAELGLLENLDAFVEVVADPWSYVGTTDLMSITGAGGDSFNMKLKYWSGNRRTINENIRSANGGNADAVAIPEIKVVDGKIPATRLTTTFNNVVTIPETDVDFTIYPFRKAWVNYTQENYKLRFALLSDESLALTSDDPLMLSNRRTFWEESPWLRQWDAPLLFSGGNGSLKRGLYSNALSYYAKDSDKNWLTFLRGVSFDADFGSMQLSSSVAAPVVIWDDYDKVNNIAAALRLKNYFTDNFMLGGTYTFRTGLNEHKKDNINNVIGLDSTYQFGENTAASIGGALSFTSSDESTAHPLSQGGSAFKASLQKTLNPAIGKIDMDFSFTYMSPEFDASLSNYVQTRYDQFWSKHISFRPIREGALPFAIGDGIDSNRYVFRLKSNAKLFTETMDNLFDIRTILPVKGLPIYNTSNQTLVNRGYIETVVRDEVTYRATDKLTAKLLGRLQHLPDTLATMDPFLIDSEGKPYMNVSIEGDKNPSVWTASLGLEYLLTNVVTLQGIYERTNDYPDFPRGLLNSSYETTRPVDGVLEDRLVTFAYDQNLFPLPPYESYNIFKARIIYRPINEIELSLQHTHNGFKFAGPVDDNINHEAIEFAYIPNQKLRLELKYIISRFIDINKRRMGEEFPYDRHYNFAGRLDYNLNKNSTLILEYGTFGYYEPASGPYSAVPWTLSTVDTEHMFRVSLKGTF